MTTYNSDIKTKAKQKGVFLWEVAEKLGIIDCNFSRKLRRELPQAEKQAIFNIIENIAAEKENAAHSATNTIDG